MTLKTIIKRSSMINWKRRTRDYQVKTWYGAIDLPLLLKTEYENSPISSKEIAPALKQITRILLKIDRLMLNLRTPDFRK